MNKCDNCPYSTRFCPPEGSSDEDLLIIGQSPGKNEVLPPKKPFCGPSGDLLNKSLSQADIDRSETFITNTIGCRIPNNESPSQEAIEACESRRENEIERVDPDVILALGATASKAVLGTEKGINKLRGKAYEKDNRIIMPTFHPANLFHDEDCYIDFHNDIQKLKNIRNGKEFPKRDDFDYGVVNKQSQVKKFLDYISDYGTVSCDLETTGLDYMECDILAWGFGIEQDRIIIIDWREINEFKTKGLINEFFENEKSPNLIWHNAQYDTKVLNYGYEMNIPCDYDTKYLHRMTDERQFGRGEGRRKLESLCGEFFNWDSWEHMVDHENMRDEDKDDLFYYLGIDCNGTYLLWKEFWGEILDGL